VDLAVNDAAVAEGGTGARSTVFTVTLSAASSQTVTVDYQTSDGTATEGSDYLPGLGTIAFPPGTISKTLIVTIIGDRIFEPDETFFVNLSNPVNGTLVDDQGLGIITNDDAQGLSIDDVTVTEPPTGTVAAVFTVTLAPTSGSTVNVNYTTVDDTATSPGDFQADSGTVEFSPGASTQPISVLVSSDAVPDGIETFFVDLTSSSGAAIAHARGTGTIFDPGAFFTLTPCRLIDTRNPDGPLGGPALVANTGRDFALAGTCGIPASATAVSVNIAVTGSTAAGNLRLHPGGTPVPLVSAINYSPGQTRSNNAVVPLNASGELSVFVGQASGTVDFILDVNGYFQ
jgi:hypothetical protein